MSVENILFKLTYAFALGVALLDLLVWRPG